MKTTYKVILGFIALVCLTNSCKEDFLDVTPNGRLDESVLANAKGIDALLIGAYSMLDGTSSQGFGWEAASSNWVYGSIRGMEANKGTDSGDQPDINPIQTFSETAANPYLNVKWRSIYEGISRANAALRVIDKALASNAITAAQADNFSNQAKALRGIFHFEAWRMWAKADGTGIPYMDKNTDPETVKNNDATVVDKIIADLQAGINLPENMGQVGRFNKTVCRVLAAKAMMQMKKDYNGAKALLLAVVGSNGATTGAGKRPDGGTIGLEPLYGDIFDINKRNGIEAIYTVQYSVNDGSGGWNGGWSEVLNFPYKGSGGSPGGCCGFFQPNQEFVNSFRTSGGLPLLDNSYNTNPDLRDQGKTGGDIWNAARKYSKNSGVTVYNPAEPFKDLGYVSLIDNNENNNPLVSPTAWQLVWTEDNSREVDPRLDWTAGRRGIPYLDWGVHTGSDWIRDQSYAGPYSPKKQVFRKSQQGQFTEVGSWTSGWTANGYRLIRYADVLLLLAECQIETAELGFALININAVRTRAANSDGFVKESDGTTNAANYVINNYVAFADQATARAALRMERKLELGMEGHRYFDLQRWGASHLQTDLTRILNYEKGLRSIQFGNATIGPEDVNYPIPLRQVELSNGNIVQNRAGG